MTVPWLLTGSLVVLLAAGMPLAAHAQESTPATTGEDARMLCAAEPRDTDELLALWFVGEGTPAATPAMAAPIEDMADLPAGEAADEATVAALIETTRGFLACILVTGEYARSFGYVTDDLAVQLGPDLSDPNQDTPEEIRARLEGQLAGTPIPDEEPSGEMPEIVGPLEARILEGGRAAAIWTVAGDQVFLVYEQQDDRWLIDEIIDIQEQGAAATPAA